MFQKALLRASSLLLLLLTASEITKGLALPSFLLPKFFKNTLQRTQQQRIFTSITDPCDDAISRRESRSLFKHFLFGLFNQCSYLNEMKKIATLATKKQLKSLVILNSHNESYKIGKNFFFMCTTSYCYEQPHPGKKIYYTCNRFGYCYPINTRNQ